MSKYGQEFEGIATEHLAKFSALPKNCQMLELLDKVTNLTAKHAAEQDSTPDEFSRTLSDAVSFVENMQRVLNPFVSTDSGIKAQYSKRLTEYRKLCAEGLIWFHLDSRYAFEAGDEGGQYWPVSLDGLADLSEKYISQPWLHCKLIDHILIDAMIYEEILGFGERIKVTVLGGNLTAELLLSSNTSYSKAKARSYLKDVAKGVFWGMISVAAGLAAAEVHGWWAGLLVGFGLWVLLKVNRYLSHYEQRKESLTISNLLADMHVISDLMEKHPLSHEYLRERLCASANKGAVWPVGIFPILDSAIRRNSETWV